MVNPNWEPFRFVLNIRLRKLKQTAKDSTLNDLIVRQIHSIINFYIFGEATLCRLLIDNVLEKFSF